MSAAHRVLGPLLALLLAPSLASATDRVVLVVGAEGEAEYGQQFAEWAGQWREHVQRSGAELREIGPGREESEASSPPSDKERLQQALADPLEDGDRLWIVLIGHGSSDGRQAKFNLRGPDVSAEELASWLDPVQSPTVAAVCCSASGPFVQRLSRRGRVVVSATKSGHEYNFSRFGGFFAAALADPAADLDHDEQVSVLEAFLFASAAVEEWYRGEARLATEHAVIDDDGDGLGTPASWFRGVRAIKSARSGAIPDGLRAGQWALEPSPRDQALSRDQRARRDALEEELEALRMRKEQMEPEAYDDALERVLVALARIAADAPAESTGEASGEASAEASDD